jgi:hypothetical protein
LDVAIAQVEATGNQFVIFQALQQFGYQTSRGQWLNRQLDGAPAWQAETMRLIGSDAVGYDFRHGARDAFPAYVIDQVVFNAAARNRADHAPVFADCQCRAFRTGAGAPCPDNGYQFALQAGIYPLLAGFQYFEVYAIHIQSAEDPLQEECYAKTVGTV